LLSKVLFRHVETTLWANRVNLEPLLNATWVKRVSLARQSDHRLIVFELLQTNCTSESIFFLFGLQNAFIRYLRGLPPSEESFSKGAVVLGVRRLAGD
jgi:hypothetical protein